jgi:hypothetical protein
MAAKPVHTVTFPVGHQPFEIRFLRRMKDDEHPVLFGTTEPDLRHININLSAHHSLDHLLSTVFHELMHAYIDTTGHDIRFDDDQEESLVKMLESNLFWLVDKQLLTKLLDCDKLNSFFKPKKP